MDVGSPENGLEELSDFLKEDGCALAAELDLSFVVNKERNAEEYVFEGLASCNEFHLDQNEQGQQAPPSLPSDLRYYEISGSASEKIHSPLQTGFDHDVFANETIFVGDQERFQSPSRNNHHQEETEMLSGSYPFKSPIQVETESCHHEIEAEVAANLQEFPLIEEANQEEAMEDKLTSPPHDKTVEETFLETSVHELTKSEFAYKEVEDEVSDIQAEKLYASPSSNYGNNESKSENIICSRNSPAKSRNRQMLHSDHRDLESTPQLSNSQGTVRQGAVSPDMSTGAYPSPSSQKVLASPERSDQGKEASKDNSFHAGRQNPASPQRIQHRSHHMDGSSVERVFPSPRNHDSYQRHRRRDRSVSRSRSRSPVRRRGSSSRHKRDHHNRSRSRSPYKRDHHRRSPRRRYSPRRRSPPSGYHSHRRSPNRRPWSPPHNRSTGLGKPGRNLFVAGFSFLTTEKDLERKFSRYGRVRDVRIVRDKRSGDSRGFGFLSLERDEEADAAIRALDKTEWNGRIVLVEKSKSH